MDDDDRTLNVFTTLTHLTHVIVIGQTNRFKQH
jgi:hypothetical protein